MEFGLGDGHSKHVLYESFQLIYIGSLGAVDLDYFLIADLTFNRSVNTVSRTDSRYLRWFLTETMDAGGGGILKTIGRVSPFVCLFTLVPFGVRKTPSTFTLIF